MPRASLRQSSFLLVLLPVGLLLASAASSAAAPAADALAPAATGGLPLIDRALARLSAYQRLLVIAAHPDDEDTTLLTHVSVARGGEAAYLSLTRGDGGQNLLGEELGVGLGLLRSRELQAARHVDGARQFFSRAYDFGYTRSLDETLGRWPLETLVDDALRVVRRFKPQVIVAIFPPDQRAGHGQHQASAVVAEQVFERARQAGEPWRPASLFRAAFFLREGDVPTLTLPLGTVEPISGRTIFQIAMESRSNHRCQDMGLLQPLGDADSRLVWVAGAGETADELFGDVDTSLSAMADPLAEPDLRRRVAVELDAIQGLALAARQNLSAARLTTDPAPLAAALSDIVRRLAAAEALLAGAPDPGADDVRMVRELVAEKQSIAQRALAAALGLAVDAFVEIGLTDSAVLVPGETFDVRVQSWQARSGDEGVPAVRLDSVRLLDAAGAEWTSRETLEPEPAQSFFATRVDSDRIFRLRVPTDAAPTVPYFLHAPLDGDLYSWQDVPGEVQAEPFGPPPLRARYSFQLPDGTTFEIEREVVVRTRDQARGEVRRPLRVAPAIEVSLSDDLLVWPSDPAAHPRTHLTATVRSHLGEPLDGQLLVRVARSDAADDVTARPSSVQILHLDAGGRSTTAVELPSPADLGPGRYRVQASFELPDGRGFAQAIQVIDYEHIRPVTRPVPAALDLAVADIALPPLERIGYVRGASDRVPEMLQELGLPVEILDADQLDDATAESLAAFDAIVIGSRAYEVEPALARANPRLLHYAEAGGLLLVQYQQYQFVQGGYAPFPIGIGRPHDRVTDETAPVRVLQPDHPAFQTPNRLGDSDWQGWVQERGLYFAGTWDDAYTPLLAMADPGRDETRGALLVAGVGEGHYVYTGLAFFRQLPAGVTGAYRLLMNLLALAGT